MHQLHRIPHPVRVVIADIIKRTESGSVRGAAERFLLDPDAIAMTSIAEALEKDGSPISRVQNAELFSVLFMQKLKRETGLRGRGRSRARL